MRPFVMVSAAVIAAALAFWWHDRREAAAPQAPPPPALSERADAMPPPFAPRRPLNIRLSAAGQRMGDQVHLRLYKEEGVLEVWLKQGRRFVLFDSYDICRFSGALGPKLKEGDGQSPEGFYEVGRAQLNPNSAYHLAFNLGYPNAYDRSLGRTGSHLMVHGNCVSIGCYAMTDAGIEDIYGLVAAALARGQRSVAVHIFPFRMSAAALAAHAGSEWDGFWANLKEGDDAFATTHAPPAVFVCGGRYAFTTGAAPPSCARIASW
ncbi:MAG: murein L,D-transpeptidase family protein [Micropepsaceae bacterium]